MLRPAEPFPERCITGNSELSLSVMFWLTDDCSVCNRGEVGSLQSFLSPTSCSEGNLLPGIHLQE